MIKGVLSTEQQDSLFPYIGSDKILRRVKKIEETVGLSNKVDAPTITGSTDTEKLASLIASLQTLGIVK